MKQLRGERVTPYRFRYRCRRHFLRLKGLKTSTCTQLGETSLSGESRKARALIGQLQR